VSKVCYDLLQRASLEIIAAMERGLELPPGAFVNRCKPDTSELRILHYPQISTKTLSEGKVKRAWPHTDFGIITLLFQDGVGGLELQDRSNPTSFLPVLPAPPAGPSEMVVNISDTLQRWTNNAIRAGVHQVSVPRALQMNGGGGLGEAIVPVRHSAIFFFKPHRETSAGPLSEFVTKDSPAAYDEITALEYQKRRTRVLYTADA
jgi:isopenicillin N synthase-like dioxygenase